MPRLSRSMLVLVAGLLAASPASATFHLNSISELMVGIGGDPNAQYVELRIESAGENAVTNTRLTAFNADGTVATVVKLSDHNVTSVR